MFSYAFKLLRGGDCINYFGDQERRVACLKISSFEREETKGIIVPRTNNSGNWEKSS